MAKHKTRNKAILIAGLILAVGVALQFSGIFDFNDLDKLGDQDYFDVQSEWYTQTGNFYELSVSGGTTSYYLSCKEFTNLEVKYKGSSTYNQIQSSSTLYFDPVTQELVSRTNANNVVDQYRLKIYANCNFPSFVESAGGVRVSGTYDANIYNSNPNGSDFYYITGISGNSITSHGMRSDQNILLKTVVFDGQALENKLKVRTSDSTVQFSVLTDTDLVFEIDTYGEKRNEYKRNSDVSSMVVSHRASVKLTDSTPAPTPTTANSRDQPIEITAVYQTALGSTNGDLLNGRTLDTTPNNNRQLTFEVKMSKYISDPSEGTPIITIKEGNGLVHGKYNTYFLKNVNDDRYFFNRVTIPQDSTVGTWSVVAENVNRASDSTKTFRILNTNVPSTALTPQQTCEANGGVYDSVNLSCDTSGGSGPIEAEPDAIEFVKVGLVWEVQDKSGNTINNGDSRAKDGFDIPNLESLELVSTTKNKAGNQQSFDKYLINPHLVFNDESGTINTDTLNQFSILESTGVTAEVTILEHQAPKITRDISQALVTNGGISMPLGLITVTRDNIDKLATDAGLELGEYFDVEIAIKGGFTIVHKTTAKQYNGYTDGTTLTQQFRYGNPDDSTNKEQECIDRSTTELTYVWKNNQCILSGGNGGECDNPNDSDCSPGILCELFNIACPENPTLREECEKLTGHTWVAGECRVIDTCVTADCSGPEEPEPRPEDEPKPDNGDAGFCQAELTTCIDDAIKKALSNQNSSKIDETMIYMILAAILVIAVLVVIVKLKSRSKFTYPS